MLQSVAVLEMIEMIESSDKKKRRKKPEQPAMDKVKQAWKLQGINVCRSPGGGGWGACSGSLS